MVESRVDIIIEADYRNRGVRNAKRDMKDFQNIGDRRSRVRNQMAAQGIGGNRRAKDGTPVAQRQKPGVTVGPDGRARDARGRFIGGDGTQQPPSRTGRRGIMPIGMPGGLLGGLAAGAVFTDVVKTAMNFETALTEIQKKGGYTTEQMAALKKEIMDVSTSGDLLQTPIELAQAYERAAAAGIPLDNLEQFAKLAAMAATAFDMSEEDTATAAAVLNKNLGIPIAKMEEYFGLVNKLADSGTSSESGILNFLTRAGANLKLFGLAEEQTAALAATLLNLGMPAEVAARAMNTLSTKMLAPGSKKAHAAFAELVGDTDEFQTLLKDDAAAALDLFLGKIDELDKFEASRLLTDFLGQGFSDEILRLAKARSELNRNLKIADDRDAYRDSLSETYKLKLGTFEAQWKKFRTNLEALEIDLGDLLLPIGADALSGLSATAQDIREGMDAFDKAIDAEEVRKAKDAVSALIAEVKELAGFSGSDSAIMNFFQDLANAVNDIAKFVNDVDTMIKGSEVKEFDGASLTPEEAQKIQDDAYSKEVEADFKPRFKSGGLRDFTKTLMGGKDYPGILDAPGYEEQKKRWLAKLKEMRGQWIEEMIANGEIERPEPVTDPRFKFVTPAEMTPSQSSAVPAETPSVEGVEASGRLLEAPTTEPSFGVETPPAAVPPVKPTSVPPPRQTHDAAGPPLIVPQAPSQTDPAWKFVPPPVIEQSVPSAAEFLSSMETERDRVVAQAEALRVLVEADAVLDTSQYEGPATDALSARNGLEKPIVATADMNIAPFLAKVEQVKQAAAGLNNLRITPGGNSSNANRLTRHQFAPVGPGN